jgi:hypothetical protein
MKAELVNIWAFIIIAAANYLNASGDDYVHSLLKKHFLFQLFSKETRVLDFRKT